MTPMVYLTLALAAAIPVTIGVYEVRMANAVWKATQAERNAQTTVCNGRIALIQNTVNEHVANRVREAREAASAIGDTPEGKAELAALCKASASCRDRAKGGKK